jgi:hypothetical protein
MLKMKMLENDPDDTDIEAFLAGYGISPVEFKLLLPDLEILLLLRSFDKLRWAIDQNVGRLESFITHARQAVASKFRTRRAP